ncbi:MAG: IclR family transcriptional regulator [Sphingopyxis sp.]|nr:IclR family transcriptional regulator [Sphingopyxis sp.]
MTSAPSPVKSAMRTLDVIEFVVAHRHGVVAQEIGKALNIPDSSLSYLLATLVDRAYLRREGRQYLPGRGLDRLRVPEAELPLSDRVAPFVRALRSELNETVSFMVRDGWEVSAVVTEASAHALRYAIEPGERKPLHTLAAGKAILATLPPEELAQYFAETVREKVTEHSVTDETELRRQVAEIRIEGFAEAREESTPGICSIGAPVMVGDMPVGAIGIAVPTIRFTDALRERSRALLRRAAVALA